MSETSERTRIKTEPYESGVILYKKMDCWDPTYTIKNLIFCVFSGYNHNQE